MSHRDRKTGSIWDLDPWERDEQSYEEIEALFIAAWECRFGGRPDSAVVRPYVQRYLRYRVIPPWVGVYAQTKLEEGAMNDIARAPLDPAIDLRLYPWHLLRLLVWHPWVAGPEEDAGIEV